MWLSEKIAEGKITVSQAANHSGGPEAVTDWMRQFAGVIPAEIRPSPQELNEFAAFFSTFLTASFDVVRKPGTRGEGPVCGCMCDICMRIINAPHLQAKKLTARDKRRAEVLMADCVLELAKASGIELEVEAADAIVKKCRRSCAYLTYGDWLIRRLHGDADGPALLALWRVIAWDPRGGMARGFQLHVQDFAQAEKLLLRVLLNRP